MLLPRFSLRTTILLVTACAVFFLIVGQGYRGSTWAVVTSVSVFTLGILLLFHALLYLIISALSRLLGSQQLAARTSRGGVQLTTEHPVAPPSSNENSAETS